MIGGVYVNTHASKDELVNRLKEIAERAGIEEAEYSFFFANDTHFTD